MSKIIKDKKRNIKIIYEIKAKDMAKELSKAKKDIISQTEPFAEHYLKCVLYKNSTNDFNAWLNTLLNILIYVNNIEVKPDSRKLSSEWLNENFFKGELNSINDIKAFMAKFNLDGFKDISNEVNDRILNDILLEYNSMSHELLKIISIENNANKATFKEIIERFIK